jgi:hypothetical protein
MPGDVKKAVELARVYLSDILQIATSQVLLEEVELSDGQQYWLITLSYPRPDASAVSLLTGQSNRAYKIVKLQADTGELVSIKIRSLAAA